MTLDKILVAIDIHESSSQIIHFGFQLAEKVAAGLNFLYVQKIDLANPDLDQEQTQEKNLYALIEQVEGIAKGFPSTEFECDVDRGFAKETILQYAEQYDHDLLVLGIHNQNKLFNMTGISYPIVEDAKIPVVLIPDSFKSLSLDHIVFTIEFTFEEIDHVFDMISMSDQIDGHLTCLHVDKSKDGEGLEKKINTYEKLLEPYIQEGKVDLGIIDGDMQDGLRIFAAENEVDLIVMLRERKNWASHYLKSSKEKQLTRKVNIPVMIIDQ